jgi:lipopolysaccharide/colanic/teichoic acid biosynthesis glycosyltransferase
MFSELPRIAFCGPLAPNCERYHRLKRGVDVAFGSLLLLLTSPLFAVIAITVKVSSPGPVFFRQLRVGTRRQVADGMETWVPVPLVIYKFRSMTAGVDETAHVRHIQLFTHGVLMPHNGTYKLVDDARVTPVGRLLRRTSLDELPQLLNVLEGGMSLVGPRPVPVYEVASYQPHHYRRLAARPGLTGLSQIRGRGGLSHEELVARDVEMISRRSLLFELKLLVLTIPAVVRGRGAS